MPPVRRDRPRADSRMGCDSAGAVKLSVAASGSTDLAAFREIEPTGPWMVNADRRIAGEQRLWRSLCGRDRRNGQYGKCKTNPSDHCAPHGFDAGRGTLCAVTRSPTISR